MSVRWQFRYCLLTYPQCGDLDAFHVSDHLSSLSAECIIAREHHRDEGVHLHAFVDFGRKFRSRNVKIFDVDGRHPNVEPTRKSPAAGWDYATKDGDIVAGGLERPQNELGNATDWSAICNATDINEFWRLCESLAPRALLCNFNSLRAFAEWRYKPKPIIYVKPRGIQIDTRAFPALDGWIQQNIIRPLEGR